MTLCDYTHMVIPVFGMVIANSTLRITRAIRYV